MHKRQLHLIQRLTRPVLIRQVLFPLPKMQLQLMLKMVSWEMEKNKVSIKVRKLLLPLQKTRFFLSNLHVPHQTKLNTVLAVLLQPLVNTVSLAKLELGPAKQVLLFLPQPTIRYVLPRLLSLLEKLTLQQLKSQQLPVTPLLKPLPL